MFNLKLFNMKKFEIVAYSLEEAKEKAAEMGITVVRNVTQSWKNANCPLNDTDFKVFAVDVMEKNRLTDASGVGLIVAVTPGSKDTKKRPYEFVNNVVEGNRNLQRVIEIRLKETDELVGEASKKDDAARLAKELMKKYRQDMVATIVYRVMEGKDVAFELKYAPSSDAKEGRYVVFGNDKSSF